MDYVKNVLSFLAIAFIINAVAEALQSNFFNDFLNDNVLIILITLLAINTATSSLIISKLQDISDKENVDFESSYNSLKNSLLEQIIIIIVCSIALVLRDSKIIEEHFSYHFLVFDSIILGSFIYGLDILYDTGKATFIIVNNLKK